MYILKVEFFNNCFVVQIWRKNISKVQTW